MKSKGTWQITAAELLKNFDSDKYMLWLRNGFNALANGNRDARPFKELYSCFPDGDDITDDLASLYRALAESGREEFCYGLNGTFKTLNASKPEDQKSLIFVLRLAAKIEHFALLPLLTKKIFPIDHSDDPSISPSIAKLRSVALDVAVELSAFSSRAADELRNIASSSLFRPSAAATLLLALCDAEPRRLLDHLFRLEKSLEHVFGTGIYGDSTLTKRRARLLVDLRELVDADTISAVIAFALQHPEWSLAWLGHVLFERSMLSEIPTDERTNIQELLEEIRSCDPLPVERPRWAAPYEMRVPTLRQYREETDAILSDEADEPILEQVYDGWVGRLQNTVAARSFNEAAIRDGVDTERCS